MQKLWSINNAGDDEHRYWEEFNNRLPAAPLHAQGKSSSACEIDWRGILLCFNIILDTLNLSLARSFLSFMCDSDEIVLTDSISIWFLIRTSTLSIFRVSRGRMQRCIWKRGWPANLSQRLHRITSCHGNSKNPKINQLNFKKEE